MLGQQQASWEKVSFTAVAIFRMYEAKIAEGWVELDALGLMQQLGAHLTSSPDSEVGTAAVSQGTANSELERTRPLSF